MKKQIQVVHEELNPRTNKPLITIEEVDMTSEEVVEFEAQQQEHLIADLRQRREIECYPIINRGELWYDNLTTEQRSELDVWYQDWLDVTDTLVVPDKPEWLK